MGSGNVELVRSLVPQPEIDWAAAIRDDEVARQLEAASKDLFEPGFACTLKGVTETRLSGFEGLRALWLEWLEPWSTYHVREERIEDLGDGRVLWTGQDSGTRSDGSGEVAMASSAIWTIRSGMVSEVVFFADRARCLREAGLG